VTASTASSSATLRSGRYAIIGELGSGSQAETLDAVDKLNGRAVAIKRFQVRGAKSWKDVELAEREARVLSTLAHPNLPVYVEHFEEDGALYLVMEKIEGETLASLRRRRATLSHADIARFLADADSVLQYLHSRVPPIIHRDIKPGNVILRRDGSFAFVDFGSVRDQLKPEGGSTVVGTFGYMAPEQFQGRALPASDVYAVGATALALVTGREPEDLPHRGLAIDVRGALGSGAEPWLVRVLSAMLDPDPDKRATRVPAPGSGRRAAANSANSAGSTRNSPPPPAARPVHHASEEWRDIRERAREQRKQVREEGRRLRREINEQVREETRRVRRLARDQSDQAYDWHRRRRRHRRGGLHGPVLLVVMVALTPARVAGWALFRLILPTLLTVLSIPFGRSFQRLAAGSQEVGVEVDQGLKHALDAVRGRATQALEAHDVEFEEVPEPHPKTRVSNAPQRVDEATDAELEQDPAEPLSDSERREHR